MAWQPGKTLRGDRYTIEEILGMGRFGITYLARKQDGTPVAIKTPNDEVQALNPAEFDRLQQGFVREAFKLARCRHPHIVRAEEPFQEDGIWHLPMEYIDGRSLGMRAIAKLPEADALQYVRQIGEALGVVHENGLLHRDVQPKNIMLRSGKPEAVLIDFGLARNVGEAITQTRTSEISDGFSPLELYSSQRECGVYTDIYALGATLYNLVTGEIPTSAPERKIHGRVLTFPDGISENVRKGIQLAMELEPRNRPESVDEWLQSLDGQQSEAVESGINTKKGLSFDRKIALWTVIFTGVAAIAALIGPFSDWINIKSNSSPTESSSPSPSPTQTP